MVKKIIASIIGIGTIGLVLFFAIDGSANRDDTYKTVKAEKGSIIDKALAVGRIEPKQEVSVKSKIPGIVRKIYVEIGDQVKVGEPLLNVAPDPTPIEFAEAKRNLEIFAVTFENDDREAKRSKSLLDKNLISQQEYESIQSTRNQSELRLQLAQDKFDLLESGRSENSKINDDNIIRSPISGTILSMEVEEGDPVVPLTTYQAGTDLITIAKMDNLIFKGNVDEIDVGKLFVGMPAEIEIGAISGDRIEGKLVRISPKAHKEEGSTLFEVEISIHGGGDIFLRAGYSANADIIITKKEDIILIPERLIRLEDSVSTIELVDSMGVITEKEIKTGLSDGINIEVIEGVDVGMEIVERPPKEITGD